MTIQKLKKLIDELVAAGHGRRRVFIRKDTYSHPCEGDGVTILDVSEAFLRSFPIADGDGFMTERSDIGLIMVGDLYDPAEDTQ